MRYSFKTGLDGTTWAEVAAVWSAADQLDVFDAGWVNDHLQGLEDRSSPSFDPFVALAALATLTRRVRLGIMVAAVGFRNPALIAKQAVTLDHLSGGRFELGIGAGWMEREHADYGLELMDVAERMDRFEEAAAIIRSLLHEETTSRSGNHYRYEAAPMWPKPVQDRLPIVIGGHGELRTIPITAVHADHYNFGVNRFKEDTPEKFRRKLAVLHGELDRIGRARSAVETSVQIIVNRTAEMAVDLGEEFIESGADHIIFFLRPPLSVALLTELAEELASRAGD